MADRRRSSAPGGRARFSRSAICRLAACGRLLILLGLGRAARGRLWRRQAAAAAARASPLTKQEYQAQLEQTAKEIGDKVGKTQTTEMTTLRSGGILPMSFCVLPTLSPISLAVCSSCAWYSCLVSGLALWAAAAAAAAATAGDEQRDQAEQDQELPHAASLQMADRKISRFRPEQTISYGQPSPHAARRIISSSGTSRSRTPRAPGAMSHVLSPAAIIFIWSRVTGPSGATRPAPRRLGRARRAGSRGRAACRAPCRIRA